VESDLNEEEKANAAKMLLRGDLLGQVVSDIKENIAEAWAVSDDIDERDKLWYLQKSIGMFEEVLEGYVSNYEFAQKLK